MVLFFRLTPRCTLTFICSPQSELCWGGKQIQNTPKPLIHTACVSQMLPGSNNVLAHPQLCWLEDTGSKGKDLSVTGHWGRVGVYSGCSSLCVHVCGLGGSYWTMSCLNDLIFDMKIWDEQHVDFISYTNISNEFKLYIKEVTYRDFWVSTVLTRPFIDLKKKEQICLKWTWENLPSLDMLASY